MKAVNNNVCGIVGISFAIIVAGMWAAEPGFDPILDRDHHDGWEECGPQGGARIRDGVLQIAPDRPFKSYLWYSKQAFSDFVLRLDYRILTPDGNSGVALRFRYPGDNMELAGNNKEHYHVDLSADPDPLQVTGAIMFVKGPQIAPPQEIGEWNAMEIAVSGQSYTVTVNGKKVNEFTGNRATEGYIGFQIGRKELHITNVRIKKVPESSGTLTATAMPPALPPIQTDPNQPRIEVIRDQGPNAVEWALAPLEEPVPPNIRQNLTYLREDLLDEAKAGPKAPAAAYTLGSEYCDKVLTALRLREQARVQAGYRAAQAEADIKVTNSQLDARRNYQMSWPQYHREESQRAALREQESSKADLKKEKVKVEWAARADQMRVALDAGYRQLRESMR